MFKNVALIALLSISSVPVFAMNSSGIPNVANTGIIKTIKNSPGTYKWLGIIVPCILSLVSAQIAITANKDNPDRKEIVAVSKFIRLLSLVTGAYFLDEWIKTDFKEFALNSGKK